MEREILRVRRLRRVLVSEVTRWPFSRLSWRRIERVALPSSKSGHCSPNASPRRSPVASMSVKSTSFRRPSSTAKNRRASSGVNVRPSGRSDLGARESRATLRVTLPQRIPWSSAWARTERIRCTVETESPSSNFWDKRRSTSNTVSRATVSRPRVGTMCWSAMPL